MVLLLFQPGEEGGGGGKLLVDAGVLKGVKAVFGMHVWPDLPSGVVATKVCLAVQRSASQ